MGKVVVIGALLALLAGAVWFAATGWMSLSDTPMPASGYIAMTLGIVFSLVVCVGLMALVFFSSRRGYDEPARRVDPDEPE
jgi:hypothetical protein